MRAAGDHSPLTGLDQQCAEIVERGWIGGAQACFDGHQYFAGDGLELSVGVNDHSVNFPPRLARCEGGISRGALASAPWLGEHAPCS